MIHALAKALREAELTATPIAPITSQHPGITPALAYEIQRINIEERLGAGDTVAGHKIGLTAKAMQELLGVSEPDYGHILASMISVSGDSVETGKLCAPRVEPEIAFRLHTRLKGPGVTANDVRNATESVAPALEIVDSRITDWKITLADTIADNASSAAVVVGDWIPVELAGELRQVAVTLMVNCGKVATGTGADVLGDPAEAVAWLANALAPFGVALEPGHVIMPGACTTAPFVHSGDDVSAEFSGIGTVAVNFK